MKKVISILASGVLLMHGAQIAFAKLPVVSRNQWGADESLTLVKQTASTTAAKDTFSEDKTEKDEDKSPAQEKDPDITRVVETDPTTGKELRWPLQYAKKIKYIVVHSTAMTNHLDDPITDIQSIFTAHAVARGWGDIGYNYLIDQKGTIYEGRKGGEKVIGGHAKPVNKVSIGISLMGNYEESEATAPMINSLIRMIDEKSRLYKIKPKGKTAYKGETYNNIMGHYENDATLCPGIYVKDALPIIRDLVEYSQHFYENGDKKGFVLLKKPEIVSVKPEKTGTFTLKIRNAGSNDWGATTYLENTNDSSLPTKMGVIQSRTAVGDVATFTITIPPQTKSRLTMPQLRIVANGSQNSSYTFPFPVLVENIIYSYDIESVEVPTQALAAGESFTGMIRIKNTGNVAWTNSGDTMLQLGTANPVNHASPLFKNATRIATLNETRVAPKAIGSFTYTINQSQQLAQKDQSETLIPVLGASTWLKGQPIVISIGASSLNKPVRVRLTDSVKNQTSYTLFSPDGVVLLNAQNKAKKRFSLSAQVKVSANPTSGYRITNTVDSSVITSSTPPRFGSAKANGVVTVVNFEKRPSWNTALNDNLFRGTIEVRKENSALYVINELGLEDYMKGLAEVPNADQLEKAKALAIAARSYAAYYRDVSEKFVGKPYQLDDNPDHTQKYLGAGFESRSSVATQAVEETKGMIITYQGKRVLTPYFSQSDGRTRSAQEVWHWTDTPYLVGVPDTFCGSTTLLGHGVGLSGCGATALAKGGKTAEEILKYYYTGISLERL